MTSITYSREVEPYRHILEALSRLYQTPVCEVHEMARRQSLLDLDPIQAEGEPFEFNSDAVPGPFDVVDFAVAWSRAKADARRCAMMLKNDPSLSEALWVFRNSVSWAKFWSVRWPDPQGREMFAKEFEAARAQLEQLEAKAWACGKIQAIETLSELSLIEE